MAAEITKFTNSEKKARLRLIRSENVGPVTFNQLIRRFGTAEKALAAIPKMAEKGGAKRKLKIAPEKEAASEASFLRDLGGKFLHHGEPNYPPLLAAMEDAPPVLSILGNDHLLAKDCFAMVGARNSSTNAKRLAQQFAQELSLQEMIIVSGLARGIDACAHIGSLESGTIAVIAGGIDIIYPKENTNLYHNIAKLGAIVTEMPLGTKPQANHFPRRNRIISGLSWGLLVIEAALKSGSLITARYAADQGRDVFALPGSPLDPRSKGTNDLIRNGAYLCETIDDILNIYNSQTRNKLFQIGSKQSSNLPEMENVEEVEKNRYRTKIIEAIGFSPILIDDLVRNLSIPYPIIWIILMELELAGKLERQSGGRINLLAHN